MIKKFVSIFKDETGAAATEFALLVPILMTMILGVLDYGFHIRRVMEVSNVARAAIEYMSQMDADDLENTQLVSQDLVTDVLSQSTLDFEEDAISFPQTMPFCECGDGTAVDCDEGTCDADGDYMRKFIEVSISYQSQTMMPWPGIAEAMNITSQTRIQIANE